ncbi:MAG: rod shape-determining protein [Eubacteriales bacterium]|nr:rod shape-determining protein [Eubacteriales bacterium]
MPIEIVADFNQDNLRLYKRGLGIIFNEEIDDTLTKKVRKILSDHEQKKIAVVGTPGETEERVACEKGILYDIGFSDLVYIQPTVALASYFGYPFTEQVPVMAVVIGDSATDLAIMLGEKILYSGILDVGVDSCVEAIKDLVAEKYDVEISYENARNIFNDVASLLKNDTRFVKFPEFILKAEQVREVIYPLYAQIIGAINHLLPQASAEVMRQILSTGVVFGGPGAKIRGLSEAVYWSLQLQTMIAQDENNATLLGAGSLLEQPQLFLNLTQNA